MQEDFVYARSNIDVNRVGNGYKHEPKYNKYITMTS